MQNLDRGLLFTFAGLTLFGLVMMSSMSVAGSFDVTGRNDYYFWRHLLYIIVGIPVFLIAFKFPLETLRKVSPLLFLFSITLLILVLVIGDNLGTFAKSWLRVGPLTFQPSELAKLSVITFLSAVLSAGHNRAKTIEAGLIPFLFIVLIPVLLIQQQPDLGSMLVLILSATTVYFLAGANLKHFSFLTGFGAISAILIYALVPRVQERVSVFINPDLDPMGAGYQVKQALIAIGSGGWFGRGFQNSIQKFDYLPEVQSDTIFAAISEEMGFIRIMFLLGAYFYIGYRGFMIAQTNTNEFNRLLAAGLTCWILFQSLINIGVNLALLPNTGITLPLLSYGGSSLWATFAAFGLLLQLSTQTSDNRRRKYTF